MAHPGDSESPKSAAKPARWWSFGGSFAWVTSIFLIGLGAKLGLILHHGLVFPYLDQWPGEAIESFMPYLTGKLTLATLFAPHNEHRILFTRILELLCLRLNGQWDSLLEMSVSAVFYCAGVAAFGWVLVSLLGRRSWPFVWLLLVAALALPFAWENTIWAFQSQFYFLIIFSLATLWLLGLSEPWSWRWWLGLVAALAAFFSMASGFLAAAVAAGMSLLLVMKQRRDWRRHIPTWVFCATLVFIGWHFRINVPGHEQSQPHSVREFLLALGKGLAWPWAIRAWYAPLNLVPLLVFGWRRLRSPDAPKLCDLMVLGLGGWAALQALAAAYARGSGGGAPAFRYMDYLSFLGIANCLSLYLLITQTSWRSRHPWWVYGGAAAWALGCVSGLGFLTERVCDRYLSEIAVEQAACLASARAFMATDDPAIFLSEPPASRPVPNPPDADIWLFRNPYLREILSVCVREPLRIVPATNADDAFVPNGWLLAEADAPTERSWGSYSAKKEAAQGSFETRPIKASSLPYLEIPVAGDLGGPGLSLELVELNSGKVTEVKPSYEPHGAWLGVHVRAPDGPFKLVARDDSASGWFAFKEPIEMGRLSVWTLQGLSMWEYLVVLGAGAALLNFVRWREEGRTPPL